MNYLSVKETADKWGISQALVRRFCGQGRIPRAKYKNGTWMIPETAKKPDKIDPQPKEKELPVLARRLMHQKNNRRNFHGLYDYVQIYLTYSSSRMASNRLTMNQVETIFRKGKIREMFEPVKVSDCVEVMNHCVCVDYILDHIGEPITQKLLQKIHYTLMFGTVDHRKQQVTPGVYRTEKATRRFRTIPEPTKINSSLSALISEYEAQSEIGLVQILDFHVRFEEIVAFEDGNGRIGRLIMFKECLRHGVTPFIIDDKRRSRYLAGIQTWHIDPIPFMQVAAIAQERFEKVIALCKLGEYRRADFVDMYAAVECSDTPSNFEDDD